MDVISRILNSGDDQTLLERAETFSIRPQIILKTLEQYSKDKTTRFKCYEDIIKRKLHTVLEGIPRIPNKQQRESKTWDEYIASFKYILMARNAQSMKAFNEFIASPISEFNTRGRLSNRTKEKLIDGMESYLEEFIIRTGLGTAVSLVCGLLRVIPSLWKEKYGENITKDQLITTLKQAKTQSIIQSFASMYVTAMSIFTNCLWRSNTEFNDTEIDTMIKDDDTKRQLYYRQPSIHELYNAKNFRLSKNNGLVLTQKTANLYNKVNAYATQHYPGERLGCPALKVKVKNPQTEQEETAMMALCNFMGDLINLIPDNQFTEMMGARNLTQDEIADIRDLEFEEIKNSPFNFMQSA